MLQSLTEVPSFAENQAPCFSFQRLWRHPRTIFIVNEGDSEDNFFLRSPVDSFFLRYAATFPCIPRLHIILKKLKNNNFITSSVTALYLGHKGVRISYLDNFRISVKRTKTNQFC